MSGGGTLSNTHAFALNHASSKLQLNSITVAKVSTSAVSLGIDVDADSIVTSLTVGHLATPVSIADGITLSGGIAVTGGSIKLGEAGTLGSTVTMSGGTILDVDDTLTISGTLTQSGAIEIDVKAGEVLTYSGAAVNLGAYTLKMSGGGTLSNTNAFALNHADSKLLLNSITVAKVSTSADNSGLDVNADSTVTSLTVANTTPVSIASSITLSGGITVTAGSIKLGEAGTLGSTVTMSGGTLDVDDTLTISGALTQSGAIEIDVKTGEVLTYSGAAVSLGAYTLTLSGGGTFSNTNALVLNDADSLLSLAGILTIGDVEGTAASNTGKGIQVSSSATLGDYDLSAESYLAIAANQTLAGQLNLQSNGELNISGDGGYTGGIALAGGKLNAVDDLTLAGTVSISASSEIIVPTDSTLVLNQTGGLSLGATTLTLSGGGNFQSAGLDLNDADSKLLLNSITVDSVSTSEDSSGLDVDANSTVTSLTVGHTTPVSIASGKTLSGAITVTAGSIKLGEAGTLGSTVSMSGGTLDVDKTLTLSGALTQSGSITIDVKAGEVLTYSGASLSLGANTLTLSGGGTLSNTNALVLNHANSLLTLAGILTIGDVDGTAASNSGKGIQVTSSATLGDYDLSAESYLAIAADKTLAGQVRLQSNGELNISGDGGYTGGIALAGGKLNAVDDLTLAGTVSISASSEIIVPTGSTLVLNQTGGLSLGANTLTLSGGGTLGNTNALVLNDANSLLSLAGILVIGDVNGTAASNSGKGIQVTSSATIGDYDLSAVSYLSIAANKTLAGQLNLQSGGVLKASGDGQYTGDIAQAGGKFSATDSQVLSGTLSITADSELAVSENYILTLSQTGGLALGANTLTLSGGGSLVSGGLTLDNASSKLLLNSITVDSVSTSLANSGLDVDNNSTVTSLTVGHTTPVSIASGITLSGGITVTGGSIKLDEAGTLGSSVSMSGGTLDADETLTVSGALSHTDDITIDVAETKTLTYTGTAISLGANTLTLSGGGNLVSGGLTLNDPSSKLLLNSIMVDSVSTSADSSSGGLDVDNDSTVSSLSVAHTTPVSIASGRTLSGAVTVTAGSIRLGETGTLVSTVSMSGGTLDADNSLTLSGALTQSGAITIDVADKKTLTYSGDALSLGAYTLTLSGGGTLVSGGLTLNDADSKLLLNSITLDNVSTSANSLGLDVDADSTVTSLSVANITPVSIASGSSLFGGITVSAGSLKLNETGTLASTIAMSGGVLDADESLAVSGALTQSGDIVIDVADNKTLTYSGTAISLGANTLTLIGGGTLSNTNALVLNNADSLLSLAGILVIGDVDGTAASNPNKGIQVTYSATIGDYDLSAVSYLSIAANKTLAGQLNLQTNGELKTSGSGQYIGDIALAGGKFSATDNQVLGGTLSITADSELSVSQNYTLTLSQTGGLALGANTLTLSGGGSLVSGGLTLNDTSSKLLLNSITVDNVSTSANSLGLDVDNNSTVSRLSVANTTPVSIASGRTLSGAITVTAGSIKLGEAGTLGSTVTMSGG